MTDPEFNDVLEAALRRRKALIEMLVAEENLLLKYGRISRRACLPKNQVKNGSGRQLVPQGVAKRP